MHHWSLLSKAMPAMRAVKWYEASNDDSKSCTIDVDEQWLHNNWFFKRNKVYPSSNKRLNKNFDSKSGFEWFENIKKLPIFVGKSVMLWPIFSNGLVPESHGLVSVILI